MSEDEIKSEPMVISMAKVKSSDMSMEEIIEMIKLIEKYDKKNNTSGKQIIIKSTVDKPILPNLTSMGFNEKLKAIQNYIDAFEYNFTNMQLSTYQKKKTFASMVDYAQILIKKSLPIRCLDGFILAAYLTCDIDKYLLRFPLRFMSKCNNKLYWHIVLGVKHTRHNKYGAIGISRKNEKLGYKACEYESLLALIKEYIKCYKSYNHEVRLITIGIPLTTNIYSEDPIFWDILQISNKKKENDINAYRNILDGVFENWFKYKDKISEDIHKSHVKAYPFDKHVIFDIKTQKYYLKKQHQFTRENKIENELDSHEGILTKPEENEEVSFAKADDLNRV